MFQNRRLTLIEMSKIKQDIAAEEETDEDFMTRITQPRIWTVYKSNFVFQVFTDERLDEVLDMFKVMSLKFCINNYGYTEQILVFFSQKCAHDFSNNGSRYCRLTSKRDHSKNHNFRKNLLLVCTFNSI